MLNEPMGICTPTTVEMSPAQSLFSVSGYIPQSFINSQGTIQLAFVIGEGVVIS